MSTSFYNPALEGATTFPSVQKPAQLQTQTPFPPANANFETPVKQATALRDESNLHFESRPGAQAGSIQLKPICIEQEAVTFRPGPITVQQPPLVIQGEPVSVPQPPIVIHPEPIVIPQAPLTFTPQAIIKPRPPITVQPEAITLARPSYSVQPVIQYDLRGCNTFGRPDLSQHVHVKLTNQEAGIPSTMSLGPSSGGKTSLAQTPTLTPAAAPAAVSMQLPAAAALPASPAAVPMQLPAAAPSPLALVPSGLAPFPPSSPVLQVRTIASAPVAGPPMGMGYGQNCQPCPYNYNANWNGNWNYAAVPGPLTLQYF